MMTDLTVHTDFSVYVANGWQNRWTREPEAALILLSIPLALTAVLLLALSRAKAKNYIRWTLALVLAPPILFAVWAAIAVAQGHRALLDELMVAGGMAMGWLVVSGLAVLARRAKWQFVVGSLLFLATPFVAIGAGFAASAAAKAWLKHRAHVQARERNFDEFQVREWALEACVKNYNAESGRRDAARALRNGDARLLYRVVHYQEGASIYVPGIEIVGNSEEGGFPSNEFFRVLGRFDGDRRWYWVDVRESTTVAPWPDPWGRIGELSGQKSAYQGKCERAEFDYLEAYNRSIPLDRVPRRLAPAPNYPDEVGWGKTLIGKEPPSAD